MVNVDEVLICSVGDLMICDSPLYASVGVGSRYKEIRLKLIEESKSQFEGADMVIGNLESVVHEPKNSGLQEVQMCCPKGALQDLSDIGFGVLNIANNHIMQHGAKAFEKTICACRAVGLHCIGEKAKHPYYVTIKGIQFALFSLCIHLEWYQPNNILYENDILDVLQKVSNLHERKPDVRIIVSIHWGDEFASHPSNAQIELAHVLVDHGADIILGHHPHVFQGVEEYNGAVIAYSQGNYISDMVPELCRRSGVLYLRIPRDGGMIRYHICAIEIGDDFIPKASDGTWIKERNEELNRVLTRKESDDDYWKMIEKNHHIGHSNFKKYFLSNIKKYRIRVATAMAVGFLFRKAKRLLGVSTDGRISSMDSRMIEAIGMAKETI